MYSKKRKIGFWEELAAWVCSSLVTTVGLCLIEVEKCALFGKILFLLGLIGFFASYLLTVRIRNAEEKREEEAEGGTLAEASAAQTVGSSSESAPSGESLAAPKKSSLLPKIFLSVLAFASVFSCFLGNKPQWWKNFLSFEHRFWFFLVAAFLALASLCLVLSVFLPKKVRRGFSIATFSVLLFYCFITTYLLHDRIISFSYFPKAQGEMILLFQKIFLLISVILFFCDSVRGHRLLPLVKTLSAVGLTVNLTVALFSIPATSLSCIPFLLRKVFLSLAFLLYFFFVTGEDAETGEEKAAHPCRPAFIASGVTFFLYYVLFMTPIATWVTDHWYGIGLFLHSFLELTVLPLLFVFFGILLLGMSKGRREMTGKVVGTVFLTIGVSLLALFLNSNILAFFITRR